PDGRPRLRVGQAVAAPARRQAEEAGREGGQGAVLVPGAGAEEDPAGAGARPGGRVARRDAAEYGPAPDGRGGGPGVLPALGRGGGVLREQAVARLARPDGVEQQGGAEGAPDGVAGGWRGGAVVCPGGDTRRAGAAPPAVVQAQGEHDDGGHAGVLPAAPVEALAGKRARETPGEVGLASGIHRHGRVRAASAPPTRRLARQDSSLSWLPTRLVSYSPGR